MIYLSSFNLVSDKSEFVFLSNPYLPTYHLTVYPFKVFPDKGLQLISFSDITIFSGGNGSGKSTLLNIIAEKLCLKRDSLFNKSSLFDNYVEQTDYKLTKLNYIDASNFREVSRIITSDDVFNHIIQVRKNNKDIDLMRGGMLEQRLEYKYNPDTRPRSIDFEDEESIKRYRDSMEMVKTSASKYIKKHLGFNERTYSNGENGFQYFTEAIKPGGLYILDEPENSLSAEFQLDLVEYIRAMARAYKCQFLISTHSPFIVSMEEATVYDMDGDPVTECKWTELMNIRLYHDFFMEHHGEF
ncbi:MAG: AAA family ATPase [Bacteroidales bacterium]|nr:AAA family ATPase [Candidatus Cacconaster scatequi]